MVRYAVFSDIHGNLEALQAFVAHSRNQGADCYLCCGDIVGYGAAPVECLEMVWELCPGKITRGNHDDAASTGKTGRMNTYARAAIEWTRQQLSEEQIRQLGRLPFELSEGEDILVVHASPYRPECWEYISGPLEAREQRKYFTQRLCFIGHTHVPFTMEFFPDGRMLRLQNKIAPIRSDARYLINVGSVGQPRDYDPRGCYVLYDSEAGTLERFRFEYDIKKAQQKITEAGLPPILAMRLEDGY